MATGFCEYDQVLMYPPVADPPTPETSFWVQYGCTIVGPPTEVPNKRWDSTIQIRVDVGDTLADVQNKIRQAFIDTAADRLGGLVLRGMDIVIPAYQKG